MSLRFLATAPWRRAPLLAVRHPAVALATAITVGILGLAGASYPLYLASSASGAFTLQLAQRCPDGLDASVTGQGPATGVAQATSDLDRRSGAALLAAGASASDLGAPIVTLDATGMGIPSSRGFEYLQLASRTDGLANISVVSSAGGSGVWLPDDLAKTLGASAGGSVRIVQDPGSQQAAPLPGALSTQVRVAGIYRSMVGTVLPQFWCDETNIFGSYDSDFPPPPVVLTTQPTLLSVSKSLDVTTLTSYQWERHLASGLSVPAATTTLSALEHFDNSVGDQGSDPQVRPQAPSIGGGLSGTAGVVDQLAFVIAHANAIEKALRSGILPVALAGLAVSALLVAASGSYWVDRRRYEVALLSARGVGPFALSLKAALENVLPIAAGAALGWVAALGLVKAIGPSPVLSTPALTDGIWSALGAAVFAFAFLWLVAGFRARGSAGKPKLTETRWRLVPFELAPLGISLWAWTDLGQQSLQAGGTSAPGVGAAFLAFPILFILSLAALAARLTYLGLGASRFKTMTRGTGRATWLASRRLSGAPRIAAICFASTAAAIGVLLYGSALTRSQDATIAAKAAVFVGSNTSVQLGDPGPIPADLRSTTTEVLVDAQAELGARQVSIVGIDPRTFSNGAYWDSSFSSSSLQDLLDRLVPPPNQTAPVPVIVVGIKPSEVVGSLDLESYGVFGSAAPVRVVGTASDFPGQNGNVPLVVVDSSVFHRFGVAVPVELWSRDAAQQVLASVNRARESAAVLVTTGTVLDQTTFAAIAWTFAYLQALGVLSGAVIVGGLLLFVSTRARSRSLAYVLSRRMGLMRKTHWVSMMIELGVMIVPGAVLGGAVGWVAVELAEPHLNPLPLLSPPPLLEVPSLTIALAAVASLIVWTAIASWAQHIADRSRASELLRADD